MIVILRDLISMIKGSNYDYTRQQAYTWHLDLLSHLSNNHRALFSAIHCNLVNQQNNYPDSPEENS